MDLEEYEKEKSAGEPALLSILPGYVGFAGLTCYAGYADFTGFGTEALIIRIYVHEKLHFPGNLVFLGTRVYYNYDYIPNHLAPG